MRLATIATILAAGSCLAAAVPDCCSQATCVTSLKSPPPPTLVCEKRGTLQHPSIFGTTREPDFDACREVCLNDSSCLTFSFLASHRNCTLYNQPINTSGFRRNSNAGAIFSNRKCYQRTCTCPYYSYSFTDAAGVTRVMHNTDEYDVVLGSTNTSSATLYAINYMHQLETADSAIVYYSSNDFTPHPLRNAPYSAIATPSSPDRPLSCSVDTSGTLTCDDPADTSYKILAYCRFSPYGKPEFDAMGVVSSISGNPTCQQIVLKQSAPTQIACQPLSPPPA